MDHGKRTLGGRADGVDGMEEEESDLRRMLRLEGMVRGY